MDLLVNIPTYTADQYSQSMGKINKAPQKTISCCSQGRKRPGYEKSCWKDWELCVCVWERDWNAAILILKNRVFPFCVNENGRRKMRWVEGQSFEIQPKPALSSFEGWNESLLTTLCFSESRFLHLEFNTYQKLRDSHRIIVLRNRRCTLLARW